MKRAGKDTTARFIMEYAASTKPAPSTCKRGFADKAKWAFARQFFPKITMPEAIRWVDMFKESNAQIIFPSNGNIHSQFDGIELGTVAFRLCMAQFATDGARDIYGDDFWADQLLPLGEDRIWNGVPRWYTEFLHKVDENSYDVANICLITDLRFANEVNRIHKVGGYCIKVKRKDAEDAVIEEARQQGREVHRSELGLQDDLFDYIIDNSDNSMVLAKRRTMQALQYIDGRHTGVPA